MERSLEELRVDVIATTMSGSISDWRKVDRIVPLFNKLGLTKVELHTAETHLAARKATCEKVLDGARTIISAGGSGTFNSVVQGCIDSGVPLAEITLGFLRKGSADLIGKAVGMPDDIEATVAVFVESLQSGRTIPCDVLQVRSGMPDARPRHFLGYGGVGIFGRIPHYTENRFIKYYKGLLGQVFGDLGPFTVGATLSTLEKTVGQVARRETSNWHITIDGQEMSNAAYQAMIIVNGDLGPDLPFARGAALGSGAFHLFAFRDLGLLKIPSQFRSGFNGSAMHNPEKWGLESYLVTKSLQLRPGHQGHFPVNTDGSTYEGMGHVEFQIVDHLNLIANEKSRWQVKPDRSQCPTSTLPSDCVGLQKGACSC